jgi:hypothetical protein
MKLPKPGAKAPSFYNGVISQGLKALLPRINAGAPTSSFHVDSKSPIRDKLAAPTTYASGRCDKYSDWLADAALGELTQSREPELLAHAAECDACREAYKRERELSAFADQIDRGVESLVSGEPSPHFNSRLRARIAEEAATPRFNWRAWTPIAAGAVTLAILLVALVIRTPRANSPNIAHQNAPLAPTSTANPSAHAPVISAQNHPPSAPAPHLRPRTPKPVISQREPEVLVEPGQMAAVMQFADAVRTGHVDGAKLVAAEQQLSAPLEIKPLEIVPLSPPEAASTAEDAPAHQTRP